MNVRVGILAMAGIVACGSSSNGNGSGGPCSLDAGSQPMIASVAKGANSDARCPDISPSQLNASPTNDSGTSACSPVISSSGCSASYDCQIGPAHLTGTVTAVGTTFNGSITVTVTGTSTLTCSYNISGTIAG